MKKIAAALFLFISMAVIALPASADPITYTVTITGTGGQVDAGVYVFPYIFTVSQDPSGLAQTVQMMCMDFDREVTPPETWHATLVPINSASLPTDVPLLTATDLDELAVLDSEIRAAAPGSQALADLQFAAWSINATTADKTTGQYHAGFTDAAAADLAAAEYSVSHGNAYGATNANNDTVLYVDYSYFNPVNDPGPDGPQRFMLYTPSTNFAPHGGPSPVPEPSSLMLLGTGVFGVAGFARRRFKA